ncbi:MAG: Na/Pi cotransporter family protein, partial [Absicoccus porci]|uniref:Na/Pi cotransporter family protein n=1 Tax=Absicoccus porci TaxID=2486576 RepID=UPI002E7A2565
MEIAINLMGGLALFLYGMQMMSGGLEAAAGDRMKSILEKLTTNRFVGILLGCVVTMIIQSSSATTVMVVGFVNAQMMALRQAVWVIMGANIGTTITGQLIALDIGAIAPLIAFIGVAMVLFLKGETKRQVGEIIAGLGILFLGMNMMSSAMMPLRHSDAFINLVSNFSNPLIGILVGAGFTALIQSSSASVGVMQALALSGIIDLHTAVYVLFGQNIGTCITAVLASIGAGREAKQTTIIHLSFNIIGTIIFTIICMSTPLTDWVISWTPTNAPKQIANMHTLFNVCTTIILIPFGYKLADFAEKILPSEPQQKKDGLLYLQPLPKSNKLIGANAINVYQVSDEIIHMMDVAYENVQDASKQLISYSSDRCDVILNREKEVNKLNEAISEYITTALSAPNINANVSQALGAFYLSLVHL